MGWHAGFRDDHTCHHGAVAQFVFEIVISEDVGTGVDVVSVRRSGRVINDFMSILAVCSCKVR